ncbi:MAG: DegT/DnrJ/EryC1/StrS family aminotransferase, partial [Ignavibacteriales bacterium]
IEGGAIIFKNKKDFERAKLMINFGITGPESIIELGINAKMNEFQAAMGLCVLDEMDIVLEQRSEIWNHYENSLKDHVQLQKRNFQCTNNYSYFPVLFESEERLMEVKAAMNEVDINPRRYFYPSLDTLGYLQPQILKTVSGDIARRIICLPIYPGLLINEVEEIIKIITRKKIYIEAIPVTQSLSSEVIFWNNKSVFR